MHKILNIYIVHHHSSVTKIKFEKKNNNNYNLSDMGIKLIKL